MENKAHIVSTRTQTHTHTKNNDQKVAGAKARAREREISSIQKTVSSFAHSENTSTSRRSKKNVKKFEHENKVFLCI